MILHRDGRLGYRPDACRHWRHDGQPAPERPRIAQRLRPSFIFAAPLSCSRGRGRGYCTGPQMIPGPQMFPDRKWSPNWTANDPGPEMIPILDRKWSRSKNKEWHGFISEKGENMYQNYELKNMFYHFTKNYSTVAVLLFEGYRSFSLSRNKKNNNKSKTNQWKKLRNCDVRYRRQLNKKLF